MCRQLPCKPSVQISGPDWKKWVARWDFGEPLPLALDRPSLYHVFPYNEEMYLFLSKAEHTATGSGILALAISSAVRVLVSRAMSIWVSIFAVPCPTRDAAAE